MTSQTNVAVASAFGSGMRINGRSAANALLLLFVPGLIGYYFWMSDTTFVDAKVIGAVTIVLSAIPLYRHLFHGVRRFPLYALNTFYYAFGFAIGPFVSPAAEKYRSDYTPDNLTACTLLCLTAIACQIAGYEIAGTHLWQSKRQATIAGLTDTQLRICGWGLLFLGQVPLFIPLIANLPSIGQFVRLASFAGFSVGLYCALQKSTPQIERTIFLAICIPLIVWTGLISGAIAEGLRFLMLATLIAMAVGKLRAATIFAIVGIVAYFVMNPVKMEFRKETWREDANYTWMQRSELLIQLVASGKSGGAGGASTPVTSLGDRNSAIDRLNQMYLLLRIVSYTPKIVPYWHGKTLTSLPAVIIPRALWPTKPVLGLGQLFGHAYRILGPFDRTTSINTPWLVELYANAGWLGVIGGMATFGVLFRMIEQKFLDLSSGDRSSILMIGLFGPLIYPESDISLMWGGVCLGFGALYAVCNVVAKVIPAGSRHS